MRYLFTSTGISRLHKLQSNTLFAFDFDGTLAPIVKVPSDASISDRTSSLMKQLSQKATTAVISGRGIQDLKNRLAFNVNYLIGNHGAEGIDQEPKVLEATKKISQQWEEELFPFYGPKSPPNPVSLENKVYSLAIHYRNAKDKKQAQVDILTQIEELIPQPRVILGKAVVNLLPEGAPNKGQALQTLISKTQSTSAFYIGDDDTDDDVFDLKDNRIFTVRVGFKPGSNAQFYLKTQLEVDHLLEILLKTEN